MLRCIVASDSPSKVCAARDAAGALAALISGDGSGGSGTPAGGAGHTLPQPKHHRRSGSAHGSHGPGAGGDVDDTGAGETGVAMADGSHLSVLVESRPVEAAGTHTKQPLSDVETLRGAFARVRAVLAALGEDVVARPPKVPTVIVALEGGVHTEPALSGDAFALPRVRSAGTAAAEAQQTQSSTFIVTWGVLYDLQSRTWVEASGPRLRLPAYVERTLVASGEHADLANAMKEYNMACGASKTPDGAVSVLASSMPTRTEMHTRLIETLVGQLVHQRRYRPGGSGGGAGAGAGAPLRAKSPKLLGMKLQPQLSTISLTSLGNLSDSDPEDSEDDIDSFQLDLDATPRDPPKSPRITVNQPPRE
jgi:non-canonical (house-cleaning) NTP pyrophosphatase